MYIYDHVRNDEWLNFMDATSLIEFISLNKSKIINQRIKAIYSTGSSFFSCSNNRMTTDSPLVFIIGDYEIVVSYMIYSDLNIIYHKANVPVNNYQGIGYKNMIDDENLFGIITKELVVKDIRILRFNSEFEINSSTGETRPDGGDYFSELIIDLHNDIKLHIGAEDAIVDGYMDVWFENK